jgi:hypothetical protein
MQELGIYLERLGPVFAALFFMLIVASGVMLLTLSTWRLVHRG